jgi:hypothetical protein
MGCVAAVLTFAVALMIVRRRGSGASSNVDDSIDMMIGGMPGSVMRMSRSNRSNNEARSRSHTRSRSRSRNSARSGGWGSNNNSRHNSLDGRGGDSDGGGAPKKTPTWAANWDNYPAAVGGGGVVDSVMTRAGTRKKSIGPAPLSAAPAATADDDATMFKNRADTLRRNTLKRARRRSQRMQALEQADAATTAAEHAQQRAADTLERLAVEEAADNATGR